MIPAKDTSQHDIDAAYLRLNTACPQLAEKLNHLDVRIAPLKEISRSIASNPNTYLVTTERLAIDGDDLVKRIDKERQKSSIMDITLPPSVDAIFSCAQGQLLLVEFKDSYVGFPRKGANKRHTFSFSRDINKFNKVTNFNQNIHRKFFETASCLLLEEAVTLKELRNNTIGIVVVRGRPNQLDRYKKSVAGNFAITMRTLSVFPRAVPKLHGWLLSNSFVIDEKTFDKVASLL